MTKGAFPAPLVTAKVDKKHKADKSIGDKVGVSGQKGLQKKIKTHCFTDCFCIFATVSIAAP